MTEPFVSACFAQPISATLEDLQPPLPPVVRSCHIGNNTPNNWAWLALARNTRHVQYDHTCYGVDELSAPWTLLGRHGYIERCVDHRGQAVPPAIGQHINDHIRQFDVRHSAHLNVGIFSAPEEGDLIAEHFATARALAGQINGSNLSSDTCEIARMMPLLQPIVADLSRSGSLACVFDRWVKTTRRGYTVIEPIRRIVQTGETLEILNSEGTPFFRGPGDALLERLARGAADAASRLETGRRPQTLDYPWFSLAFSYLIPMLEESAAQPHRTRFWHGGGSASCYYIRDSGLAADFERLRQALVTHGHLAPRATLTMIPTFVAQFFATTSASEAALDAMLRRWRRLLATCPSARLQAIAAMEAGRSPADIAATFLAELPAAEVAALGSTLEDFNAADDHSLPIAHLGHLRHPTYNKYSLPQRALIGRSIRFASQLYELTWGEAELLCRSLAELVRDLRPAAADR